MALRRAKEGQRILLVNMPDDPAPIPAGATGVVEHITETSWGRQISVQWDPPNETRSLMLAERTDVYDVLRVRVLIENTYSDGHSSSREVEIDAPGADIDAWWEESVFPLTGDGHGSDSSLGSCYTATIKACAYEPLVGLTTEWTD